MKYNLLKIVRDEQLFFDKLHDLIEDFVVDFLRRKMDDRYLPPQKKRVYRRLLNLLTQGRGRVEIDVSILIVDERREHGRS